jgi:DNA helicase-2/ATP-dependent DNA helicase PcrA
MAKSQAKFRPSQAKIIQDYQGGLMGIAAVPGSGKTFTLSHLAARLVGELSAKGLGEREVLIVTFSNSAVNSFKKRIADILQRERGMLPFVGYRVRTLHGLAHDLVRERPALVGLPEDFQILDERITAGILREVVTNQLPLIPKLPDFYLSPDLKANQLKKFKQMDFPDLMMDIAGRFIKQAKDSKQTPATLAAAWARSGEKFPLLEFMLGVYERYQRALLYRGAVDFDDLVMLALQTLEADPQYLQRLQKRWVYVLEDEAQDSSQLQEEMLQKLTGEKNWVRVGDPNQAINTTFTTADSSFLRQFLTRPKVKKRDLPTSGRCGPAIIEIANELVRWTRADHPAPALRGAFYPQQIVPTEANDPQQNPPASQTRIHIHYEPGKKIEPDREIDLVVKNLKDFLAKSPEKTVAVLVPANHRGFKVAEALQAANIPYDELLRSTSSARQAAHQISLLLTYLSQAASPAALLRVYREVWSALKPQEDRYDLDMEGVSKFLGKVREVEDLVYPLEGLANLPLPEDLDPPSQEDLREFLAFIQYALGALALPPDQLILTLSQRLFREAVDIALAYKMAAFLRSLVENNRANDQQATWGLPEFIQELKLIVDNQRRFIGFEDAGEGYIALGGVPTIATMHAAKGLEWDRVYLMSLSNYDFPALQKSDRYAGEKWFIRGHENLGTGSLNLEAELLAQFASVLHHQAYLEGEATLQAREAYCAERLRLLYVALTRAKSELIITWNIGRSTPDGTENYPALPVQYLQTTLKT